MDDNYYLSLAVLDRINEEVIAKFGGPCIFAKHLKKTRTYWTDLLRSRYSIQVDTFIRLAEAVGVSVEYLLTGKNKQPYKPVEVCYDVLLAKYQDYICNKRYLCGAIIPHTLKVLTGIIKKRKCNITLTTLFRFEDLLHTSAYQLAFKELNTPATPENSP